MSKKALLLILDGWGCGDKTQSDVITSTPTPYWDSLLSQYPHAQLRTDGLNVGLPEGQMGNSEVGHMNIGGGRIVYQELTRITKEIQDGEFFENKELLAAVENCKKNNTALHTFGLLSDGGVHSHITHLYGLLELAKRAGLEKVYVHAFLDGRDTAPTSGKGFLKDLQNKMNEIGVGEIASIHGRYYAMDRDNRWDRVEKAYAALVYGEGNQADCAFCAIKKSYAEDVTDEFVVPTVVAKDGKAIATISENDSVVFFNFRPDRAREITRAFCSDDFTGFERRNGRFNLKFVCFSEYDVTIPNKSVAFEKIAITNTFGEFLIRELIQSTLQRLKREK